MAKIDVWANYGVLQHEFKTVFTVSAPHCNAKTYDKVEISLPEGFSVNENEFGAVLIDAPDGQTYLANEIISSEGDFPMLRWGDTSKTNKTKCDFNEVN